MSSSPVSSARSVYRQYTATGGSVNSENLPPRTLARLAREVRDLHKNPPDNVKLVVDGDSGLPANLGELMVSCVVLLCGDAVVAFARACGVDMLHVSPCLLSMMMYRGVKFVISHSYGSDA
jgi:hypothetical protein